MLKKMDPTRTTDSKHVKAMKAHIKKRLGRSLASTNQYEEALLADAE